MWRRAWACESRAHQPHDPDERPSEPDGRRREPDESDELGDTNDCCEPGDPNEPGSGRHTVTGSYMTWSICGSAIVARLKGERSSVQS